jgi:hypothetical protein
MIELNKNLIDGQSDGSSDENQSNLAEEYLLKNKEIEDKLKKSEEEKDNYKKAFLSLKEKQRELELSNQNQNYQNEGNQDEYHQSFEAVYNELRQKEKMEEKAKALKNAFVKFQQKYPQYSPENDLNDMNYNRLKSITDKIYLGDNVDEIIDTLEFAHRGLQKPKNPTNELEVGDSGIGETSTNIKGKEKFPSALTRPLNEFEAKMASIYEGGEVAYRKAISEQEDRMRKK